MYIITNNKDVYNKYSEVFEMRFLENLTLLDILKVCRDEVHLGSELLTHPLTGSIKPNETPFKSIMLSKEKGPLNFDSLNLIEHAIEVTEKFLNNAKIKHWPDNILEDFRLIDFGLITSAIESIGK